MVPCYQCRAACASEFLGTLTLVVAGAGIVALTSLWNLDGSLPLVALVFGVTVAALGMTLGRFSGAHVNPAVSLAHVFAGRLRVGLCVPLVFFQVLGAIVAGIILRLVFPVSPASNFLGSTSLASSVTPWAGIILESAGTFTLSSVILYTPLQGLGPRGKSIIVGAALFLLILILGPFTGASLNPARSLGPALVSGHLENLEVYIAGPLAGGLVAGAIGRMRK
jgi:MIP family channel proteins